MAISDFIRSSKTARLEKKKKIHRALIVRRRTKDGGVSIIESASPSRSSSKTVYFVKSALVDRPLSNPVHVVRLSDPSLAGEVQKLSERLKADPDFAMKLLREAGIATPSGKLSQRYGG